MSYDLGFDLYDPWMDYQTTRWPMDPMSETMGGRGLDTYRRSPDWGTTAAMPYGGSRGWPATDELSLLRGGMSEWQPKCIARAAEGGMLVEATLPGVKREDINLHIVDGNLLLSGERKEEKSREREGYWSRESSYGKFQRRLWLPEDAQLDQIKASFDNGMLNVFIPLPGRQRQMDMGQGRGQMQEEGRQTRMEWGGAQAQPAAARDLYPSAPRQEERGPVQQAGTMEEMKPLSERPREEMKPLPERRDEMKPLPERREEMKPLPERREEETKPLLEKGKERMDTVQRRSGSGIFIGSEATTTGASNV